MLPSQKQKQKGSIVSNRVIDQQNATQFFSITRNFTANIMTEVM